MAKLAARNRDDAGMLVGAMEYMAPEQFLGRPIGERCDIHAAGTILYQLLTGKSPFPTQLGLSSGWLRHLRQRPVGCHLERRARHLPLPGVVRYPAVASTNAGRAVSARRRQHTFRRWRPLTPPLRWRGARAWSWQQPRQCSTCPNEPRRPYPLKGRPLMWAGTQLDRPLRRPNRRTWLLPSRPKGAGHRRSVVRHPRLSAVNPFRAGACQ
jgi:serine/threonine protein kinase